jgi:hydroxymethylpyrimidine/phosphomethylpyrimidine kinase
MTIAGSDSGAGAGLQADLKTFAALGVFGTSVVTAVTAQNTARVQSVVAMDPATVDLQIDALLSDMPVVAVKTGMLATSAAVATVARRAAAGELPHLVVDPVVVSSTGRTLLDEDAVGSYIDLLLPHAELVTPNTREAAILTGKAQDEICDVEAMVEAGRHLLAMGARNVLVKGGHLEGEGSPDVLVSRGGEGSNSILVLESARVVSQNDHGTGCTLSAAITALLARQSELSFAVRRAKSYVTSAIDGAKAWRLGAGHGPLDHFGWSPGDGCSGASEPGEARTAEPQGAQRTQGPQAGRHPGRLH